MSTDTLENKSVKKTILTAIAVIGTSTLLFMGLQAVSASEQEKGGEVENSDLPEAGNITPELPDPVVEVPSIQPEEEAQVEKKVPSAQQEKATVENQVSTAQPEGEASVVKDEISEPVRLIGETLEEYRLRNQ